MSERKGDCYPITWGDEEPVREPGEHAWQQQPFWNQDWRLWCSRCCLLLQSEVAPS